MNLYLDDDMAMRSLVARLRRAGHRVVVPNDAALSGVWDPLHLLHAIRHQLVLVSKNHDDFRDLHLLVQAASGRICSAPSPRSYSPFFTSLRRAPVIQIFQPVYHFFGS